MGFQLKKGEKYVIDRLGAKWIQVNPEILNGTEVWAHAVRTATHTYFRKGFGFPRLGNDDCDCRIYPGKNRIAFAWGFRKPTGEIWVAANVYQFDNAIKEQLIAKGLIPKHMLMRQ